MPLLYVLKSYVRSHSRTLPSGRTITVPAYFTKVVPKGEQAGPGRRRALKQEPPRGVYQPLQPEQLAHRLLRHVQEGSLTHEEAEANIAHLERRAAQGHGLEHGHGPAWTHEHVKQFVEHARGKLQTHRVEQMRQQQEKEEQERQKQAAEQKRQEAAARKQQRDEAKQRREVRAQAQEAQQRERGRQTYAHVEALNAYAKAVQQWGQTHGTASPSSTDTGPEVEAYRDALLAYSDAATAFHRSWLLVHQEPRSATLQTYQTAFGTQGQVDAPAIYQTPDGTQVRVTTEAYNPPGSPGVLLLRHAEVMPTAQRIKGAVVDKRGYGPRLAQEMELHAQTFDKAPRHITQAIKKARPIRQINPPDAEKTGYYTAGNRTIVAHAYAGHPESIDTVWRHEYGHHIDHEMPYTLRHGAALVTGSELAKPQMEQDRAALVQANPETAEALEAQRDRRRTMRATVQDAWMKQGSERAFGAAWKERGLTPEDLDTLQPDWRTAGTMRHARLLTQWDDKDAGGFFAGLPLADSNLWMIQDAIGAVTRNDVKMLHTHADDYYGDKDTHNHLHCTEAYANWFQTQGTGVPVYAKIYAHFLPQTDKAFARITRAWLKTPSTRV